MVTYVKSVTKLNLGKEKHIELEVLLCTLPSLNVILKEQLSVLYYYLRSSIIKCRRETMGTHNMPFFPSVRTMFYYLFPT